MKTLKVGAACLTDYETFEDVTADLPRFIDEVFNTPIPSREISGAHRCYPATLSARGENTMSAKLFKTDILFLQRMLAVSGFYKGPLNGKWSSDVDAAEENFLTRYEEIKGQAGELDNRTEACIMSLIPAAQIKAREFMNAVKGRPLTYRIISGTRTYAEQDALFAKRPRVTKARGGQSNHNFGIAWDVGIFENGKYYEGNTKKEDKAYVELGAFIKANVAGLEWGGDWKSFVDKPHYQLATGKSVAQVRALLEKGKSYV